jgi:hypothetical protein
MYQQSLSISKEEKATALKAKLTPAVRTTEVREMVIERHMIYEKKTNLTVGL